MKLIPEYDPVSQEALNYEELAKELVNFDRFGHVALEGTILEFPLPETAKIYDFPPYRNGQAGSGA